MKLGRNDPCLCGSGRKYKHCCLLDEERNWRVLRAAGRSKTPEEAGRLLREGPQMFTFRVELESMGHTDLDGTVSRTIRIGGDESLYDLHLAIQDAFGWDNDHMFSFYLSGEIGDERTEYKGDPEGEWASYRDAGSSRSAADTQIGDLELEPLRSFRYLFDYGDMLVHKLTVQTVGKLEAGETSGARVVASDGDAPRQYPDAEQ